MNSVEDANQGSPVRERSWWTTTTQWRNWPLLVKLGMVLVVPVVAALVLGVLRVRADVSLANSYSDIEQLASLRSELVSVLSVLQRERILAVQQSGSASPVYQRWAQGTDVTLADLEDQVRNSPQLGPLAAARYRDLTYALSNLTVARQAAAYGADPGVEFSIYSTVINAVLEFDRTLVSRFSDEQLTGLSTALYDLQVAGEQVSFQQAIGLVGLSHGSLTQIQLNLLVEANTRLDDAIGDARAVAPADLWQRYLSTVSGPDVDQRSTFVQSARDRGTIALPFSVPDWNSANDATTTLMANMARVTASQLREVSSDLQNTISNRAGTQSVLLLVMVLLAAGVGGVIGRYLLRQVGLLHRTALDVAHNRLPAAVESIRAGEERNVSLDPVPLYTTEEFGQLARAFDAVNGQAVRSAAEEARLRGNMRNIFANLSRRSQGLVERQLRLMEQLEQRADDPDALANLFKLDHLATRMRRNNENLLVLSGMDLGRRVGEPMSLPDVLRAAVSEVEHYQRAIVRSAPTARIVGYAAGDLTRAVAELVENATAFSPPASQVIINSRLIDDGSVLIDILDEGIGMGEAELAEANQRVTAGGGGDMPVSRQMGLFVVGSLTARHGIRVRLLPRDDGEAGLRASLLVPATLVSAEDAEPEPRQPEPRPLPAPAPEPETERRPALALVPVSGHAVSDRLESAGIFVTLPDLPAATSPASILFAARTPVLESNGSGPRPAVVDATGPQEFAWLGGGSSAPSPSPRPRTEPPSPVVAAEAGPGGLPKRIPQAQLLASQSQDREPRRPVTRDAAKARGFLNSFQAGIRRTADNESKGEGTT